MVECCGKLRSSPFCPTCGRALQAKSPLHSLLAYLRSQEEKYKGEKAKAEKGVLENPESSRSQDYLRRTGTFVAKWGAWSAAVASVLEGDHQADTSQATEPNP
jgi:hypothetical protein